MGATRDGTSPRQANDDASSWGPPAEVDPTPIDACLGVEYVETDVVRDATSIDGEWDGSDPCDHRWSAEGPCFDAVRHPRLVATTGHRREGPQPARRDLGSASAFARDPEAKGRGST